MGTAILKKPDSRIRFKTIKRDVHQITDILQRKDDDNVGNSIYGLQYSGERLKFDLLASPKRSHGSLMMVIS